MKLELGVKFCGVTSAADIRKAESVGADAIGIIVQPDSISHVPSSKSHTVNMRQEFVDATL